MRHPLYVTEEVDCDLAFLRMASGPGISRNREKSGNFVALKKFQGKVRKFHEIQKSQGILARNWEKSGNFTWVK